MTTSRHLTPAAPVSSRALVAWEDSDPEDVLLDPADGGGAELRGSVPASPEAVEYLLRFDTLLGRFPESLRLGEGALEIAGQSVVLRAPTADGAPPDWKALDVAVVVEASGERRSRAQLEAHLAAGAKRVVLCSPPAEPPDLTLVAGVNDQELESRHRIVSVRRDHAGHSVGHGRGRAGHPGRGPDLHGLGDDRRPR